MQGAPGPPSLPESSVISAPCSSRFFPLPALGVCLPLQAPSVHALLADSRLQGRHPPTPCSLGGRWGGVTRHRLVESDGVSGSGLLCGAWVLLPLGLVWRRRAARPCLGQSTAEGRRSVARGGQSRATTGAARRCGEGCLQVAGGGGARPGLVLTTSPLCSCRATDGWSSWRRPCGTPPGTRELPPRSPIPHPRVPRSPHTRAPHPAGAHPRAPVVPTAGHLFAASEPFTPLSSVPCAHPQLAVLETTPEVGCGVYRRDQEKLAGIHPPPQVADRRQVPKPHTSLYRPAFAAHSDAGGQGASETSPLLAGRESEPRRVTSGGFFPQGPAGWLRSIPQ